MDLSQKGCHLINGEAKSGKSTAARYLAGKALQDPKVHVLHLSYEETMNTVRLGYTYGEGAVPPIDMPRLTLGTPETHNGFEWFAEAVKSFKENHEGSKIVVVVDPLDFLATPGEQVLLRDKLEEFAKANEVAIIATQHSTAASLRGTR